MVVQSVLILLVLFGCFTFFWKKVLIPFLYGNQSDPATIAAKKADLDSLSKQSKDLDSEIEVTTKLSTVKSDVKLKQSTLNELDNELKEQ